eukprot:CAMPEP_0196726996 /NCGR_PEP_ID=MMETSP1091-20130531/8089_1 /TAXON_ID=302021 /ORGANISM="Rhodomonas sp., Strain CCMP768" /LENGTH=53 /DNA_ID=CAMNT_0042069517 /DNA_START=19 /DNA_END=180 /DNA_ORIENTATION=-
MGSKQQVKHTGLGFHNMKAVKPSTRKGSSVSIDASVGFPTDRAGSPDQSQAPV